MAPQTRRREEPRRDKRTAFFEPPNVVWKRYMRRPPQRAPRRPTNWLTPLLPCPAKQECRTAGGDGILRYPTAQLPAPEAPCWRRAALRHTRSLPGDAWDGRSRQHRGELQASGLPPKKPTSRADSPRNSPITEQTD